MEKLSELTAENLRFPVIVKPNFEGSSKGITQDSVAETLDEVRAKVAQALAKYPAGVLVEEYISGRDLTVPFLAAVDNDFDGVLSPVEYVIDPAAARGPQVRHLRLRPEGEERQAPSACAPRPTSPRRRPRTCARWRRRSSRCWTAGIWAASTSA